ncbi:MAG: hypothetical protein AAFR81_21530 [Chloroflexota bacterium]
MVELNHSSHVVTLELVRTLDETETAVEMSKSEGLRRQQGNPLDVEIRHFSDIVGLVARNASDHTYMNRVMRVTAKHVDLLEEIITWYREQDVQYRVEIIPHLTDEALLRELFRLGLAPAEFNTVFYARPPSDPQSLPAEVEVKTYVDDDLEAFATLFTTLYSDLSVSQKDALRIETLARHSQPGWRCYLAWVGGELGAWSRMYIRGNTASFSGAMSLPKYRQRGLQAALLRQRKLDAKALGCNLFVSQATPGTTSQRNMERAGFRVAYNKVRWRDLHGTSTS